MKQKVKAYLKKQPFLKKIFRMVKTGSAFKPTYTKIIKGQGNKLQFDSSALFVDCKIAISGNNNEIIVKDGTYLLHVKIEIKGNNNRIEINSGVLFNVSSKMVIEEDNCLISIGNNTSLESTDFELTEPGSKVIIGKECMISYNVDISIANTNSIIDLHTNKRINNAKNISIGDHVWIAAHVSVVSGSHISPNSVVAARSLIEKRFDQENSLIGGTPASILKSNINWARERFYEN